MRLYAKDFVTKELLDLHCWINWRTLQPTSSLSWCISHVLGSVHQLVTGSRALKREIVTTLQVQLGIGIRVQL